ncbi:MAG: cobalamin-binding protein [Candidatus Omnitrophica bacterium]|nr:cobalamin-binding protein [Candidatus Omnitrophota bacterium]MBI3010548.1 cobalamin-binding protein [Candidatus Omnitrophota bacterium]
MRICSFLPSGTEILCALGAGEDIVGVSHECHYPPEVLQKPKIIRTILDPEQMSSEDIDRKVRHSLKYQESLYRVDEQMLRQLHPDLIVTQQLCEVCAVNLDHILKVIRTLKSQPQLVALHPHTIQDMFEEIQLLGEATGRQHQAMALVDTCQGRIRKIQRLIDGARRPRIFCLEWLNPPMASGHWVPEMVHLAGGIEVLGRAGEASRYVKGSEIIAARPEILVLMPCGFSIERTRREWSLVTHQPWWQALPAVREGRVFIADGPAYFNGAGPRLIDGIEQLANLIHPNRVEYGFPL